MMVGDSSMKEAYGPGIPPLHYRISQDQTEYVVVLVAMACIQQKGSSPINFRAI